MDEEDATLDKDGVEEFSGRFWLNFLLFIYMSDIPVSSFYKFIIYWI